MYAIQMRPNKINTMPLIRKTVFIAPPLHSQCLGKKPQGENRRDPVKAVPKQRGAAQRAILSAEHVRHHVDDSDERDEPHHECANPPQHFVTLLLFFDFFPLATFACGNGFTPDENRLKIWECLCVKLS